jgi:Protein of unknown function (DUF3093)
VQSREWQEKIRWPWWIWFLLLSLDFSIVIAIWAGLGNTAALIATAVTIGLTCYFYLVTTLKISVKDEVLCVGRAHIEKKFIGAITILEENEFKYLRGAGINPSAFHAFRFWLKTGVKIEINDYRDPTPYWLVSSKKPEKFSEALKS